MAEFEAKDQKVEVNGETVLSVIEGMGVFIEKAYKILEKNGIKDPKPGDWYKQQDWLDAFKEISEKIGDNTLHSIGSKIPYNAKWPPEVKSVPEALASIDIAYHMNHRIDGVPLYDPETKVMKEGIGHYLFEKKGENVGTVTCDDPYPCAFDAGLIEAVSKKFAEKGQTIQMNHDERCRKDGRRICIYVVGW